MSSISHIVSRGRSAPAPAAPARARAPRRAAGTPIPASPAPEVLADLTSGALSRAIAIEDGAAEEVRHGAERVHASTLARDWCPRRHALFLRYRDSLATTQSPRAADRLLWAIGRAVEHHIRTRMISILGLTNVWGGWTCRCGGATRSGFGEVHVCPSCATPVTNYVEQTLAPAGSVVFGNPDIIYRSAPQALRVGEIKSIKIKDFEALESPIVDHVEQASVYQVLLRSHLPQGYSVSRSVHIIYGAKDYPRPGVLPYKDFLTPGSTRTDALVASANADLAALYAGTTNRLPRRLTACNSPTAPRAKKCEACALCFNLAD